MRNAVFIHGLEVRGGGRRILGIPELEICKGELAGLLGPNGAGKSTLLRCLVGMQGQVRGEVRVFGEEVGRLGASGLARLRRRIGYVPQILPVGGEMPLTVREVVAIGRTGIAGLFRPLRREDWRMVDEWLARLGLGDLAGRGFGEISGGEQRKALIARAMVQEPEMLLLDEPTANLDLGWRERIVEIIGNLHKSMGLTVVLVCHELEVLPGCCGRVVVLERGGIIGDGAPREVLSTELIGLLYGSGLGVVESGGRFAVVPAGVSGRAAGEAVHA